MPAFRVGRRRSRTRRWMVGAHTDSPTFKVRLRDDVRRAGCRLAGVESYGGGLCNSHRPDGRAAG